VLRIDGANDYGICPNVYHYNFAIVNNTFKSEVRKNLQSVDFVSSTNEDLENWRGFFPSTCYSNDGIREVRVFRSEEDKTLESPTEEKYEDISKGIHNNLESR
jgi:hypothetical protein